MAATKHVILLLTGLLCVSQVRSYSLLQNQFDLLIKPRCFNRSTTTGQELVLGQNEPVGMSIENVISLIERMERLNPTLKPDQVLKLFLERFHIDGVKYNGHQNQQSNLEFQHAKLTKAILSEVSSDQLPPFPEDQFTEDEKCNLFYTISHVVNTTALHDEDDKYTYWSLQQKTQKAPPRDMGKEVPVTQKPTTPKAVQADFLEDLPNSAKGKKLRRKRDAPTVKNIRLTNRPRENGVASFLSSKRSPIAVNRVLLGMLVGFRNSANKKVSDILRVIEKSKAADVPDSEVDTLLAVTLSDLFGIDTGDGMTNQNDKTIFGGDGEWKSTVCHTHFIINSEGTWATMAEFRGGLDGYNIGIYLPTLLKEFPSITASQVLRFYYSRNGLSDLDGVCHRDKNLNANIRDDLRIEATNYLTLWNAVFYSNQYSYETMTGYIGEVEKQFTDTLKKAAARNDEEEAMCRGEFASDIRSKPLESTLDALFMLDITRKCSQETECNQAAYVRNLVKNLKLGRGLGSVSVLFNARGVENPNLVDDEMKPVVTPLYSILYNSTSNECAACRAASYDSMSRELINDRVELLSQVNLTLANFEEKRSNESGVPGKALFWFDFGTAKPIPSDKIQAVKYEQVKRVLLHVQRDWTWFGLAANTSNLKDMVWQDGNLLSVDSNQAAIPNNIAQLSQKVAEVPSVFQYGDCKIRTSRNNTHVGLITPGYKQYWAIYPDTFRSSSRIELRFSAESSPIEVCHSRVPKPETASENCKKATKAKDEVSWVVFSPCKDLTFEKCPPLYFTITVDKSASAHCTEMRCQNIDQTKWYFSHTGISCNRASAASISLLFIAFTTIVSYAFNKHLL